MKRSPSGTRIDVLIARFCGHEASFKGQKSRWYPLNCHFGVYTVLRCCTSCLGFRSSYCSASPVSDFLTMSLTVQDFHETFNITSCTASVHTCRITRFYYFFPPIKKKTKQKLYITITIFQCITCWKSTLSTPSICTLKHVKTQFKHNINTSVLLHCFKYICCALVLLFCRLILRLMHWIKAISW